jgi:hypothetical protein
MQLSLFLLSAAAMVSAATATETAPVELGNAGDYVILSKTGISTEPSSSITGNMGVSPIAATAMTGFALTMDEEEREDEVDLIFSTSVQLAGRAFAPEYSDSIRTELITSVSNMEAAYTDAAGRPNADDSRINLSGGKFNTATTLTPGVYTFDTDVAINAGLTFSGGEDDIFIVQMTGSLTQAANTDVVLAGKAQAKNIFWQVAGSVEVGAGSVLNGIVLVKTAAVFKTGASLHGRVLTQTACTLDQASITEPEAQ